MWEGREVIILKLQIEKLSERSRKRIEIRFLWEHPFLPMPSSAITEVKSLKKE